MSIPSHSFTLLAEYLLMILDVRLRDAGPIQIQNVRMFTYYPESFGDALPELVIHFYPEVMTPQMHITLSRIAEMRVSND